MPADISVIVSTYNRGARLAATLESLIAACDMASGAGSDAGSGYSRTSIELLIVDNNSTDNTGDVIRAFAARHPCIRPLFEARQGVSFGRNAALAVASAPIVVFTDDDVVVQPEWLRVIVGAFEANEGIDYVSGRIRPIWPSAKLPEWMPQVNNGPLALRDAGDRPQFGKPGCFFGGWATANLAFRRRVFDRIGGFNPAFPRGQDLELMLRVWRAGFRGMYAPGVIVHHVVEPERMTRAYHRAWHARQGALRARLRFFEIFDRHDRIVDPTDGPMLFGVPRQMYRTQLRHAGRWLAATLSGNSARAFAAECQLRQVASYIAGRRVRCAASGWRLLRWS